MLAYLLSEYSHHTSFEQELNQHGSNVSCYIFFKDKKNGAAEAAPLCLLSLLLFRARLEVEVQSSVQKLVLIAVNTIFQIPVLNVCNDILGNCYITA